MTGRQLYNYLMVSARSGLNMYASHPSGATSGVITLIDRYDGKVRLLCRKIEPGEQTKKDMTAGKLFEWLHDNYEKPELDGQVEVVFVKSDSSYSYGRTVRQLLSVSEVPCYKGKALYLETKKPR